MRNSTDDWQRLEAERVRRDEEILQRLESEKANRLAELARHKLADFLRAAWHIVEPATPLMWGWHLDAICDHLEAVTRGEIRNLLITLPPGCTKSILVGVMWPAWVWVKNPAIRWLFAANEGDLATRDSTACRDLIQSDWYRQHFPGVQIVSDQNVKTWYRNSARGHRQALTVNSSVTGKKGDILVVDDPNDAKHVESEADRKAVTRWWGAFYNRVNDYKTGRRVVIGQRTHQGDLQGVCREAGFEELCITEEFEPHRSRATVLGWTDPRTQEGEWLRPERFGPDQKKEAIATLGSAGYRAQHQQDPQSLEGYRFKADWLKRRWRFCPSSPDFAILEDARGKYRFKLTGSERFFTVDPASSAKTSADFTVISVWTNSPRGDLIWLDCVRAQLEIPDQPKLLEDVYLKHKPRSIGIEAVASNRALFQFAQRLRLPVRQLNPKGQDKLAHASGAMIVAEAGGLWLPDPSAVKGFPAREVMDELIQFTGSPADLHDDVVDTLSYAVEMRPQVSSGGSSPPSSYAPSGIANGFRLGPTGR